MKRNLCVVALLVVGTAFGLHGAAPEHRAHLAEDVARHVARQTTARARLFVHGDAATIDAIAGRHHLEVVRRLEHGAVLAANSAETAALAADPAVDHLSGDLPVSTSMSVSTVSTAADQTRAGAPGLLGIGPFPPSPDKASASR